MLALVERDTLETSSELLVSKALENWMHYNEADSEIAMSERLWMRLEKAVRVSLITYAELQQQLAMSSLSYFALVRQIVHLGKPPAYPCLRSTGLPACVIMSITKLFSDLQITLSCFTNVLIPIGSSVNLASQHLITEVICNNWGRKFPGTEYSAEIGQVTADSSTVIKTAAPEIGEGITIKLRNRYYINEIEFELFSNRYKDILFLNKIIVTCVITCCIYFPAAIIDTPIHT